MTRTATTAPARTFTPHIDPACPACGSTDPGLDVLGGMVGDVDTLDVEGDRIVTRCCGENPIAFICYETVTRQRRYTLPNSSTLTYDWPERCGETVYRSPEDTAPDFCPHCGQ
ncbi:hypothetical protein [Streptosporangium sp. NPDC002524]|uniref:hypothetical protein n=1 Tax=Streptosporangium sp. NPDC002524 TaxID=3154537 RepID=UPI003327444C